MLIASMLKIKFYRIPVKFFIAQKNTHKEQIVYRIKDNTFYMKHFLM